MVRSGLALDYVLYSSGAYVKQEQQAMTDRLGMWGGEFVAPWDWRKGIRLSVGQDRECAIKGNINDHGERIYHIPDSRWYGRTKISPEKGEQWFCTEDEAKAAGWRAPKR